MIENPLCKEDFAVATGTMASAVNTSVSVPLPNGWSNEFTYAIGNIVKHSNGVWYSNNAVNIYGIDSNGVYVATTASAFLNQPFKILLKRIL